MVPPALQMIGQEPPDISKKVWPGKARHLVPNDAASCPGRMADYVRKAFDTLSVEMNLRIGKFRKAFELLSNAALRTMASIQRW